MRVRLSGEEQLRLLCFFLVKPTDVRADTHLQLTRDLGKICISQGAAATPNVRYVCDEGALRHLACLVHRYSRETKGGADKEVP